MRQRTDEEIALRRANQAAADEMGRHCMREAELASRDEMVLWLTDWAGRNGATLDLRGECGFGRPCVGIVRHGKFPEYTWHANPGGIHAPAEEWELVQHACWVPEHAYHKDDCVAVLGWDDGSLRELFAWGRWFDRNDWVCEEVPQTPQPGLGAIGFLLGQHYSVRICPREFTDAAKQKRSDERKEAIDGQLREELERLTREYGAEAVKAMAEGMQ